MSGAWPVNCFDETLPTNKKKAEWFRFRDKFERIISCKGNVDPGNKLTALKIHAGTYLLSIIEMHEKILPGHNGVYSEVIKALNSYFHKACDTSKERMTFREMRMRSSESCMDCVLRLETQAKFCDFNSQQRQEEFLQALLRRSIPEIGVKLYELSEMFDKNIERIVNHGQHLDYIRRETEELRKDKEDSSMGESQAVNVIQYKKEFQRKRESTGRRFLGRASGSGISRFGRSSKCTRCGESHGPAQCRAFRVMPQL